MEFQNLACKTCALRVCRQLNMFYKKFPTLVKIRRYWEIAAPHVFRWFCLSFEGFAYGVSCSMLLLGGKEWKRENTHSKRK